MEAKPEALVHATFFFFFPLRTRLDLSPPLDRSGFLFPVCLNKPVVLLKWLRGVLDKKQKRAILRGRTWLWRLWCGGPEGRSTPNNALGSRSPDPTSETYRPPQHSCPHWQSPLISDRVCGITQHSSVQTPTCLWESEDPLWFWAWTHNGPPPSHTQPHSPPCVPECSMPPVSQTPPTSRLPLGASPPGVCYSRIPESTAGKPLSSLGPQGTTLVLQGFQKTALLFHYLRSTSWPLLSAGIFWAPGSLGSLLSSDSHPAHSLELM